MKIKIESAASNVANNGKYSYRFIKENFPFNSVLATCDINSNFSNNSISISFEFNDRADILFYENLQHSFIFNKNMKWLNHAKCGPTTDFNNKEITKNCFSCTIQSLPFYTFQVIVNESMFDKKTTLNFVYTPSDIRAVAKGFLMFWSILAYFLKTDIIDLLDQSVLSIEQRAFNLYTNIKDFFAMWLPGPNNENFFKNMLYSSEDLNVEFWCLVLFAGTSVFSPGSAVN